MMVKSMINVRSVLKLKKYLLYVLQIDMAINIKIIFI